MIIVGIVPAGSGVSPAVEFRPAADVASAVAAYCAGYVPPLDPTDYTGADAAGLDLSIPWDYDHGAGVFIERIDQIRADLVTEVKAHRDQRFGVLLAEWPAGSGLWFGCGLTSQINWGNLATLDALGLVIYPFEVTTHDEGDTVALTDTADLTAAISAVSAVVLGERATAAAVIADVLAAAPATAAQAAAAAYLAS